MTPRQKILKWIYPLFRWFQHRSGGGKILKNRHEKPPPVSFYSLQAELNTGRELSFETLRGKKVLLVNTASNCGYTSLYEELQELYRQSKGSLEIIAFPANDFKEQEKGSDEEIARFCKLHYDVSFPLVRKSTVQKKEAQHPVFRWLSSKSLNGWNDLGPVWNFSKYLVNEEGMLSYYFDPAVSPLSDELIRAVNE